MGLQLLDLDEETRRFMLLELDRDLALGDPEIPYRSKYLTPAGRERYPELLRQAIEDGSDDTLAEALKGPGMFVESYTRTSASGASIEAKVPHTAQQTLAEGEFNRFYLRALCRRLIDAGAGTVEVYRARASREPRAESEAMIGTRLEPQALLENLRANTLVDVALQLPSGPNSGLSGKLC